jgi:hypothetical protein
MLSTGFVFVVAKATSDKLKAGSFGPGGPCRLALALYPRDRQYRINQPLLKLLLPIDQPSDLFFAPHRCCF